MEVATMLIGGDSGGVDRPTRRPRPPERSARSEQFYRTSRRNLHARKTAAPT